ncbi:SpoIIE family protein phosphatase [Nonomuraea ferruginea]
MATGHSGGTAAAVGSGRHVRGLERPSVRRLRDPGAADRGGGRRGRGRRGHTAAALALGAVVAARPQTAGTEEEDLGGCARAARDELALAERATGLDLIVLDAGERPRLRYAHVGGGAIWYCAKGGRPRRLTRPGDGPVGTAEPEVGSVPLHQGDRIVVVTDGVVTALGAERMTALFADGRSPASCLDQLYDEMSVVEPEEDATVLVADFVTA